MPSYALYPHMTVEQNLAFGLKLRKTPKDEIKRRVDEAITMLGLEPYLKRKPAALPGGQRQRVAMGRAIVREPQAFLMDEPLSNLDAKLRVSMRASLSQLHERLGVTTVYVTHDQVEAMTLGHRVCVLRDGRLQQVDTPQHLYQSPVNLFVAGFIGSPAMNFATAELIRDDGPAVTFAGYKLPVPADVLQAKPRLTEYFGKRIIVGIRPSDFEDASLGNADRGTMRVVAGVTEELGSDINVIFTIDAPHVEHTSLTQSAEAAAWVRLRPPPPSSAASPCGQPGCPRRAWSSTGSRSSWPSTPATCSSSTRATACPSATRRPPPAWPSRERTHVTTGKDGPVSTEYLPRVRIASRSASGRSAGRGWTCYV